MTREERLDWLCRLRSGLVWFDVPPKERPMFENALSEEIEALSAEPCEDAISRQAVMDAMYDLCGEESLKDNPWRDNPHIDSITDAIEHLPSVTPKQKMGRWISFGLQGEIDGQIVRAFTCSECGAISIFRLSGGNIVNGDMCPNCGTRMGESEGNND